MNCLPKSSIFPLLLVAMMMATKSYPAVETIQLQQLRSDVQRLEQQVRAQQRAIERLQQELERQSRDPASAGEVLVLPRSNADALDSATPPPWLDIDNWRRLSAGLSALEVVEILGPPRSSRDADSGGKVLYYSMELGEGAFLAGTVTIGDGEVVDVQIPALK